MPKREKFRSRRRRINAGKRKKTRKTNKRRPKIIYVYRDANIPQREPQYIQQPIQPTQQGAFTWGDAGKLLAVDVGANVINNAWDENM